MDTDCVWLTDSDMARLQEQEKKFVNRHIVRSVCHGPIGPGLAV